MLELTSLEVLSIDVDGATDSIDVDGLTDSIDVDGTIDSIDVDGATDSIDVVTGLNVLTLSDVEITELELLDV